MSWEAIGAIASILALPIAVFFGLRERGKRRRTNVRAAIADSGSGKTRQEAPARHEAISVSPPLGRLPKSVRGRAAVLAQLHEHASQADDRVHVLAGLGGMGKSTIALKIASEMKAERRRVWWVNAENHSQVVMAFMQIARDDLGVDKEHVSEALSGRRSPADLFWNAIERSEETGSSLLIVDNADDLLQFAAPGARRVADGDGWIRGSTNCFTIVTSRNRDKDVWGPRAVVHAVEPLSAEVGAEVLRDLAVEATDKENSAALAQMLHGLPLALHLAGSLINTRHGPRTFGAYLEDMDRHLFQEAPRPIHSTAPDDRDTITRTWAISLDHIKTRQDIDVRPLIAILAQFSAPQIIPDILVNPENVTRITRDMKAQDVSTALALLNQVGIIDVIGSGLVPGVRLHPLVAESIRMQALDDIQKPWRHFFRPNRPRSHWEAAVVLVHEASQNLDQRSSRNWPIWQALAAHLGRLLATAPEREGRGLHKLLEAIAPAVHALWAAGDYPQGERLVQASLAAYRSLDVDRDLTLLAIEHQYTLILRSRGELTQAEILLRRITRMHAKILGRDHPKTLRTQHNLAALLLDQGDLDGSEALFRTILDTQERIHGAEHIETLRARHNIAAILRMRGDYEGAAPLYREVVAAREAVLGPDHPETLTVRHGLAALIHARGGHQQAEKLYADVLAIQSKRLGSEHPETLITQHSLALLLWETGRRAMAAQHLRAVLTGREHVLGMNHPATVQARDDLSGVMTEGPR